MSKQATKPELTAEDQAAQIAALEAQLAALKGSTPVADFSAEKADAEKQGFKAQVVPSLQKGAAAALRVDY